MKFRYVDTLAPRIFALLVFVTNSYGSSLLTYMILLMYHLQNAFILTFAGFLYISSFFSLYIKYLGIFLSDTKNIVNEDTGKAFKKQKNYFHSFGG